jgi:hypothetical protein
MTLLANADNSSQPWLAHWQVVYRRVQKASKKRRIHTPTSSPFACSHLQEGSEKTPRQDHVPDTVSSYRG